MVEIMVEERVCIQASVTGRVQGVFFRVETRNAALDMGLSGWVKNLPDGSVLTQLCGQPAQVDAMMGWLSHGPALARVDGVERIEVECMELSGFDILP